MALLAAALFCTLLVAGQTSARPDEGGAAPTDPCTVTGTPGPDVLTGTPGDDVICAFDGDDVLRGGDGKDRLLGGSGNDRLYGGGDNDRLRAGAGDDRLFGEDGSDNLRGGLGGDRLSGGPGRDLGDYLAHDAGVSLSAGNGANDGEQGEDDEIELDVENLRGGSGNDSLQGDEGANWLHGFGGDDRLRGGMDNDRVYGGMGDDTLEGRDAASFYDILFCGGGGSDGAMADTPDRVGADCENVAQNHAPSDLSLSGASVAENEPAATTVGTLAATDPDAGDTHAYSLIDGTGSADNGSFTLAGATLRTNAVFDYETKSGYSVRVRVTDADGAGYEEQFAIAVTDAAENRGPVAVDDSEATSEDTQLELPVSGAGSPAANDSDADGDPLTVTAVSGATGGAVSIVSGTIQFDPAANLCGADAAGFDYTVSDGRGGTDIGHVTVDLTCVDDPPTAVDDSATVTEGASSIAIDVLANDTDIDGGPKTIDSVTQPANGTVVITGGGSGLTYAPAANFCGDDDLSYTLNGGSTAQVAVTVDCVDDPPVAIDDTATVAEDAAATAIDVLANDTDIDGGPRMVESVTLPTNGTVVITGGGSGLTYQLAANYCGGDSFTYTLNGGSAATVTVTVDCVDDPPTAVDDAATVAEDAAATAVDVLANDTDIDGGPRTVESVTQPTNGTVVITGGGSGLTYAPAANFCGGDSFTYTLNGGSTADVAVTVTCVEDAPTAVDDAATVVEDSTPTAIDVLANDTDPDGGVKTIISVTQPTNGTVVITGLGSGLTYQPAANYCGPDGFTYTLNGGSSATVAITVTCVDDPPTAVNDTATVAEDAGATAIDVLANDTDIDGGPKTIDSVTQPTNGGTVVITGGGSGLTYQPAANYCGPDSFTYTLNGGSSAAVAVTVTCVDDPPTAVDDAATLDEDATATAIDVLANDTDPDGGPRTVDSVTQPTNGGTVVITGGGGGLTYAPAANFCGTDTFTYTLNGGSTATVTLTVTCIEDAPTAVDDAATVVEDSTPTAIDVLANDTDPDGGVKTITSVTQPTNGTVVITGLGSGLTYQPAANYCGPDSFTYTINGGSSATVAITVTCVDDPPTAVDDTATVAEDAGATAIDVLANDTDIDGGPMTIDSVTQPTNGGTVVITGGGSGLTYAPAANYCGPDSFTYTLNGGSSATVAITVTCVDDPPTAVNDAATVNEDAAATAIDVLANDTDPDGGTKTITSVTQPTNGTVVVTGGGSGLTYAPAANYCGPDSFTYTLNGGSIATVAITVTCVDDPPTAVNDAATVAEDAAATAIDVLANDTDPDGGTKTIDAVTQPANGTVAITGGGSGLTYQPAANFCGTNTFTYTLAEGGSTATVTVTVTCVNDAPTNTVPGAQTVNEDTNLTFSGANSNALSVADLDAATGNVQTTVSAQNGTITPASGSGATVTGSGTVSAQITGTLTQVNAALAGLVYRGASNWNSTRGSETLTVVTSDQGNSGSGGAQTDTDTVAITVTAVNDKPVAAAKSFTVQTNMQRSLSGLLDGASDPDSGDGNYNASFTLTSVTVGSGTCSGCTISNLNAANGTVDVDPPGGATGSLTITYTITDSGNPSPGAISDPQTITLNISGPVIWFVNAATGSDTTGKGTLAAPFQTIAKVDTVDAANHAIFLYSGTYANGITLNASETLVGQGTTGSPSFDALFGITPPAGTIARPPLATGTATVQGTVTLASSATLRGLALSTGTATGLTGSGGQSGIDVAQVSVTTTTGTAVNLNNATGSYAFSSISTNGAANGILLDTLGASSFSAGGGSIVGATTRGIDINGGTGPITYSGTITTSASGRSVEVTNRTGGTVTLSGAVTDSGLGINLNANSGATINFTGGIAATTGTNAAFSATGGGIVNVTGSANTLTTSTGTALNVVNTTIGASGLTFRSISANGAVNGILLNNTGASGGVTITGTGANNSGGSIQNTTGHGVSLTSTTNFSADELSITGANLAGVDGTDVTNFAFTDGEIVNAGDSRTNNLLGAIAFNDQAGNENNIDGTLVITGNLLKDHHGGGVDVFNRSGTITDATVSNNTIDSPADEALSREDAISFNLFGSATTVASLTKAQIEDNVITDHPSGNGIVILGAQTNISPAPTGSIGTPGSATNRVLIDGNLLTGDPTLRFGGAAILAGVEGRGVGNFDITNNGTVASPITNVGTHAIATGNSGSSEVEYLIQGNRISANNFEGGGLGIRSASDRHIMVGGSTLATPILKTIIDNNVVRNTTGGGIRILASNSNGTSEVKVTNNDVAGGAVGSSVSAPPIAVENGSSADITFNPTMCATITGNTTAANVTASPNVFPGILLAKRTGQFGITGGLTPSPAPNATTEAFLTGLNPNSSLGAGFYDGKRVVVNVGDNLVSCTHPPGF